MNALPDVLRPGLRLVICGSAAGAVSAARGAYYAGPGNKFWPILAEVGLTPRLLRPDEFATLPAFGIGLTTWPRARPVAMRRCRRMPMMWPASASGSLRCGPASSLSTASVQPLRFMECQAPNLLMV